MEAEESTSRVNFVTSIKWVKIGIARSNPEKVQLSKDELIQVIKDTKSKLRDRQDGAAGGSSTQDEFGFDDYDEDDDGNYCAVGSMTLFIQVWDIDVINCIEPAFTLGKAASQKKNSPHVGHTDAVLALVWNTTYDHVMASGSVDQTILLRDLEKLTSSITISAFDEKIQYMEWHPFKAQTLLAKAREKDRWAADSYRDSRVPATALRGGSLATQLVSFCPPYRFSILVLWLISSFSLRRLKAGSFLIMDSNFCDNTILSTPKPLVSSTVKKTKPQREMPSTGLSGYGPCSKSPEKGPRNVELEEASVAPAATMEIIRESYAAVPLIETPINDSNVEESLSISAIARILSSSENNPTRLIDKFLTKKSDKENICNDTRSSVDTKKSPASMRSPNSLSSLPEGKLPIETTKSELVWGCVKRGKTLSQDFVIRNRSSNHLRIQCSLTSPAFKLINDSELLKTIKLILQPYEVRTIRVAFVPVAVGAAVGQIRFTSLDPYHQQNKNQMVQLFGYGGFSILSVIGLYKDTTGKFLLSLGYLDKSHNLERSFKVRNIGTLPSFTHIIITKRAINCCVELLVSPKRFVLLPNEEKEIKFTSTRSKGSLKGFYNAVMELGTVKLVSGPEVIRGRLRRLCRKASSMGEHVDDFIAQLVEKIPGEVMPDDLQHLKEFAQAMPELLQCLTEKDVTVVLEQDVDATLVPPLCDETLMFQSLCESNLTIIENNKVEPSSLTLILPTKMEDLIVLTSSGNKNYEINCSPEGLDVRPNRGVIAADETVIVRVRSGSNVRNGSKFNLTINLDNEAFHVDVKVIVVNVS